MKQLVHEKSPRAVFRSKQFSWSLQRRAWDLVFKATNIITFLLWPSCGYGCCDFDNLEECGAKKKVNLGNLGQDCDFSQGSNALDTMKTPSWLSMKLNTKHTMNDQKPMMLNIQHDSCLRVSACVFRPLDAFARASNSIVDRWINFSSHVNIPAGCSIQQTMH